MGARTSAATRWGVAPLPTYDQALLLPGLRKSVSQVASQGMVVPYSYQASIGFQRQFGSTTGLQMDYVYNAGRHQLRSVNLNLTFNPVTGAPYATTDAAHMSPMLIRTTTRSRRHSTGA